jgi:6-pyruvoyl-tetrahydropterin synthase
VPVSARPHPQVEFVIEAEELDENQMVCDFKIIKEAVGEWLDTFDHALCMNTADPAYPDFKAALRRPDHRFRKPGPDHRIDGRTIFDHATAALATYAGRPDTRYRLAAGVRLVRVRVWETTSSWAEYQHPLTMPHKSLPDIQATPDTRGIAIDQVGVSDLRYPIQVTDHEGNPFPTVATISMSVHLPHQFKGTHMSRFLEVLSKHEGEVTSRTLPDILHDLKQQLHAEEAHIEVAFTYFVTKNAPVSGAPAKVACDCVFMGTSNGSRDDLVLRVTVPSPPSARAARKSAITVPTTNAVTSPWKCAPGARAAAANSS